MTLLQMLDAIGVKVETRHYIEQAFGNSKESFMVSTTKVMGHEWIANRSKMGEASGYEGQI